MRLASLGVAFGLGIAAASAAHATSPGYDQCVARAGGVTSAMRDCAATEYARQDRELNRVYQAARARLDPARRERLKLEERGWLKRRTAQCRARMTADAGGTAALLDADSCTLELTDKRIAELRAIAGVG